jgi:toxin HigB-1
MEVEITDDDLRRLELERDFDAGFPPEAVRGFRKVMQVIRAAADERDLYALKSLRFEKLQGKRAHQRSLRLNKQWRLIVEIVPATPKNTVAIIGIEDYH